MAGLIQNDAMVIIIHITAFGQNTDAKLMVTLIKTECFSEVEDSEQVATVIYIYIYITLTFIS